MASVNTTHVKVINGISRSIVATYSPVGATDTSDDDGVDIMEATTSSEGSEVLEVPHRSAAAVCAYFSLDLIFLIPPIDKLLYPVW